MLAAGAMIHTPVVTQAQKMERAGRDQQCDRSVDSQCMVHGRPRSGSGDDSEKLPVTTAMFENYEG